MRGVEHQRGEANDSVCGTQFCVWTALVFFYVTQHGIEHRVTPDRRIYTPLLGDVLVGFPQAVHRGVQIFGLQAYFHTLTDD